jgi:hypothetical protein
VKHVDYFDSFLENTVNLNQTRLDLLDSRVDSIVVEFGIDDQVGAMLVEHIPQGSWAHRTIIKPLTGDEFDADFLLQLTERDDWSADPQRYVNEVYNAFRRSPRYSDMVRRKCRCVRIVYADDCHVDVAPYLVRVDGSKVIVNRDENKFEDTNPEGFTEWMRERDDLANENLRKVIRLLKYLRDFKNTFSCPSVILTTLLGEHVLPLEAAARYADVPTALKNITADLDEWLQLYPYMPTISDPSCPGTTFNHRWDQDQYANFRNQIHRYAAWIGDANDEPDHDKSVAAWQRIFGDAFKATRSVSLVERAVSKMFPSEPAAPREEFIDSRFQLSPRYHATIRGYAVENRMYAPTLIRRGGRRLDKHLPLRFTVETDTPWPYDVYWKVRNFGAEASRLGALRGELVKDPNPSEPHHESTLYTGVHYIEAYVVRDDQVVAIDRHPVAIK